MGGLIAEAASRGRVGLEVVSVDSTVVRAHHESAGLAVSGEVLDAIELALTKQSVVGAGAVGDRVLSGASQHGDRLDRFAVVGQQSVPVGVSAQDVRQDHGMASWWSDFFPETVCRSR
jgi:hypothetical protein